MPVEEFHYRLRWRTRGQQPGFHAGAQRGLGFEFRGLAPLAASGDPRRLDLRASARDPLRQLLVRLYTQPAAVPVYALADLSASMGFRGAGRKLDVVADFVAALGYSAFRTGDPLAVIGCDREIRPEFTRKLGWARAAGQEIAARLRAHEPRAGGAEALLDAAATLPPKRALVFLLSDFYLSFDLVDAVVAQLAHHELIPVVIRDSAEVSLPPFGLVRVRDAESGSERTLLVRGKLREMLATDSRAHDEELLRRFTLAGARPITLVDRFDAALVTRHFYG
jgi:uncharacterized protein (DUF58 family)